MRLSRRSLALTEPRQIKAVEGVSRAARSQLDRLNIRVEFVAQWGRGGLGHHRNKELDAERLPIVEILPSVDANRGQIATRPRAIVPNLIGTRVVKMLKHRERAVLVGWSAGRRACDGE